MERALILAEILRDQIRSGAPRESLLWTLGMIRTEILGIPPAVVDAPSGVTAIAEGAGMPVDDSPPNSSSVAHIDEPYGQRMAQPLRPVAAPVFGPALSDAPTSSPIPSAGRVHQTAAPEVNQSVADLGSSLNDTLRQDGRELVERLVPETVSDLRKAFGINDRFRYIHELFGGDAVVFDDVVQRLNGMKGLPEAVAYLDGELGPRLGWNAEDPLVRQWHQLLSRRFSAM